MAITHLSASEEDAYLRKTVAGYCRKPAVLKFRTELTRNGLGDLEGFAPVLYDHLDIKSLRDFEKREELLRSDALENVGFTPCQKQRLVVAAKQIWADDDMELAVFTNKVHATKAAMDAEEALEQAREAETVAADEVEAAQAALAKHQIGEDEWLAVFTKKVHATKAAMDAEEALEHAHEAETVAADEVERAFASRRSY